MVILTFYYNSFFVNIKKSPNNVSTQSDKLISLMPQRFNLCVATHRVAIQVVMNYKQYN